MNAIDLFAGCGGLSKGFMDAGFDIIVGVDNDQDALNTFALNHNGAKPLNADLSKQETFDEIKKIAGDKTIDVIIAGPPCQGFSLTGPRNFDDERNKLYLAVIEMVKQYKPKAFIIENVPGMATLYKGQIKEEILKRFRDMGYNIDCEVLKACDYGVPQMRKRLIFMGIRKDLGEPCFPEAQFGPGTDRPYRTCREAISDLPTRHVSIASPLAGTDLLLCALFGGVISGIGSGLAIRYGGAMDGIEVMAVIFAKRAGVTVGTFVMVYNIILYIICGCVLQSWVLPLYSIVAYSAALKTVDFIVEGIDRARQSKVCNYCDRVAT